MIVSECFKDLNSIDQDGIIAANWIFGIVLIRIAAIWWALVAGAISMVPVFDVRVFLDPRRRRESKDQEVWTKILEEDDW